LSGREHDTHFSGMPKSVWIAAVAVLIAPPQLEAQVATFGFAPYKL
jgi:hypothetical protein